jgi:hypothetical protein
MDKVSKTYKVRVSAYSYLEAWKPRLALFGDLGNTACTRCCRESRTRLEVYLSSGNSELQRRNVGCGKLTSKAANDS